MKVKEYVAIAAVIVLLFVFGPFAGVSQAQVVCDRDQVSFSTTWGPAGTIVEVSGSGAFPNREATVLWDGTTTVATMTTDGMGNYSGSFTVPSDAAVGDHTVVVTVPDEVFSVPCSLTFTVTAGVQRDAYVVTSTASGQTLPRTGMMMILTAAGLAATGIGMSLAKRQRG